MNPQQLEQLLLLESSGELSPSQRRALDAELAASAEARRMASRLAVRCGTMSVKALRQPQTVSRVSNSGSLSS